MNIPFESANRTAQSPRNLNRAAKRKEVLRRATLEQLELRTLLSSTLDITAGVLTYAANAASNLTVSSNGTTETFTDSSQTITLTAAAVTAGWSGSASNTVTGPESSITSMSIGGTDNAGQSLTLDFSNGDPLPASGLTYDPTAASSGSNSLTLQGGSFISETYSATDAGAGTITYSDSANSNVPISFSNLSPVIDTVTSPTFIFDATAAATTVNIVDGPTVSGTQTDEINDGGTVTFELIDFANKTVVTANINNAGATTTLDVSNGAVGLSTLYVNSGAGSDNVNVEAVPSGIAVNVDTGSVSGSTTTVGDASLTADILSPVAVRSTGGSNTLTIDDSADSSSTTVTLDNSSGNESAPSEVTGLSSGAIEYGAGITAVNINGGSGGNTFNVNATATGTTTTINKGTGANTVNVAAIASGSTLDLTGTGSPDTVNLGSGGSLANIRGQLELNEAANSTDLVVDLSGDDLPHDLTLSGDGTTSTLTDADGNMAPFSFNTASVASFTLDTSPFQDESLTVDFSTGNPLPATFILDGGANSNSTPDSHSITITGTPPTGAFVSETEDAGSPSTGSITFTDSGGNDTELEYSGIQPITDTVPAFTYTFDDTATDQSFTATNGPTVGGFDTIQFTNTPSNPSTATFETTTVANKGTIIFNAPNQGNTGLTGTIDIPIASTGLTTLGFNIYANSGNQIAVTALPAGVATSLYSGPAADITNITGAGVPSGTTLTMTGGAGVDTLDYDADGLTPTITAGAAPGEVLITIPGAGTVDATGYENVDLTHVAPVVITPGATTPIHAVEGAPATTIVGKFTLPLAAIGITNPAGLPAGDFTALINWGDGSSSAGTITQDTSNPGLYYITGTHTYAASGAFTVSNTVSFTGATYSSTLNGATVSVTVAAAGPTAGTSASATVAAAALSAQGTTVTGTEGISLGSVLVATFMDSGTIASPAGYTATINWGDGSSPTVASSITSTGTADGTLFSVFGNHIYADEGSYPITVTITKTTSGATAVASSQAVIADATLTAGAAVALTPHTGTIIGPAVGSFTDADPIAPISDFTAIIYWGDGSNSAGTIDQPGGVGTPFIVVGTHAYATPGVYSITTNVTDVGGSAVTLTGSATVTDVAVTGAVRSFPAVEGQNTGTIVLGTFTDPNPLATAADLTATLGIGDWGDGTPAAATNLTVTQIGGTATTSLFEITGSHTYADEGAYTVNISVTTSGGVTTALTSGTATVADAVLSPSLGTPITATEDAPAATYVVGTFTDENPGATIADFSAVVTATSSSGATFTGTGVTFTALGGGAFSVSAVLAFPTAGTWSVSTLVTDVGGNKALLNTIAYVAFAPLTPVTPAPIVSTAKLSTGLVVVGTFTDPNPNPPASDFSSVIDWGDGSPTSLGTISITPGVGGGPSTINILGMHTYETYGQYTITTVTTEDGVQSVTTTSTGIANQPHLVFVNGPATTVAGNKLPVIKVYADDAFGNLAFQDHSSIKLEIFTGTPAEGKLIGVVNAKIKDGIAQFSRISLKIAGDYTLVAVDGRYAQAVSSVFSITPAAAKKVAFTSLPADAAANTPFGVQVQIWDKFGNLEKSDSSVVTLALGKHPHQAALSGVVTATASGGIADFTDLVVSASGAYKLVAGDSDELPKASSATFDVH
jgi:hypothetical protein